MYDRLIIIFKEILRSRLYTFINEMKYLSSMDDNLERREAKSARYILHAEFHYQNFMHINFYPGQAGHQLRMTFHNKLVSINPHGTIVTKEHFTQARRFQAINVQTCFENTYIYIYSKFNLPFDPQNWHYFLANLIGEKLLFLLSNFTPYRFALIPFSIN